MRREAEVRPTEVGRQNLEWRMDRGQDIIWSRRQTSGARGGDSSGVQEWTTLPGGTLTGSR
jgi:hypothetical protein